MARLVPLYIAILAAVFTPASNAHTRVETAKPASGAVLDRSPPVVEIKFKHSVQMTSIVAVDAGKVERKLSFAPTTSTKVITIDNPGLAAGRSEIRWKALAKDGHVIGGTLIYIIQPAVTSL
jgi:methionine-rich copper-binding protein CopC